VIVNYSSAKGGAEKVVAEIIAAGGRTVAVQADVSNSADVDRLYSETKSVFGDVDVVVVLSKELGPKKIRVNAINPGMVETEGTHTAGFIGSDFQKQVEQQVPLGRIGVPGRHSPYRRIPGFG
jgi:3-oxoacyl-[acyl-carrier protein] reductase